VHALAVLSMKNRALIALVTIVAAVFGGIALTSLKQELAPSVQFPQLAIITNYPGAAPEVVNDDVSTPIETAIQGVAGLESTAATSSTNLSLISATFTYGTDLATAEQKINQAINRIKSRLPADLDPQVLSGSLDDLPVIQLAATGADGDTDALSEALSRTAVPDIEDVDGVREAAVVGDVGQRVTITRIPPNCRARGLRPPTSAALSSRTVCSSQPEQSPRTTQPSRCRPGRSSVRSMTSPGCLWWARRNRATSSHSATCHPSPSPTTQ
jgi:HAE1 family hydrophobic/amphiphilic exporter-1